MNIATISTRITNPLSVRFLLIIMLAEIFLGGGGRLINIGPLSVRMYFYVFALLISGALLLKGRPAHTVFLALLCAVTVMFAFSSVIGKLNGASVSAILGDIKPLLVFYSLLFFHFTISKITDVELVVRLLKFCGIVLALLYVIVFVLINAKLIAFVPLYNTLSKTEEFFFRGEFAFFYKGFIYMCFAAIFYACDPNRHRKAITLLGLAIFLTFTRGFFISILLTFFFYHVVIARSFSKLVLFLVSTLIVLSVSWGYYNQKKLNRASSDSARVVQVEEVAERTTLLTSIIGHGYGVGIPSRPDRMEIVYLETFHKQGLVGLIFWFSLAFVVWFYYKRALGRGFDSIAISFLLSVVFIYIESISNPYLTNPIGLNMVLIALVCLKVIGDQEVVIPVNEPITP